MSEDKNSIAERTHHLLKIVYNDFIEHRNETSQMYVRIEKMEQVLDNLTANLGNLKELQSIDENIHALKVGLVDQNTTILSQNGTLIQPVAKTQNILGNIVIISLLSILVIAVILLLRETNKSIEISPTTGLKVSGPNK